MKKELLSPILVLGGAVATLLLSGCASSNTYTEASPPLSAVAYTTVTEPRELAKWSDDWRLQRNLRSMDTYYFQVPDTGYRPGGAETTTMATPDNEAAGGPGAFQSASGGYRVIRHRPGGAATP